MKRKPAKNERTSKRIATYASEILGAGIEPDQIIPLRRKEGPPFLTTGKVILAICGSATTQAPDRPKHKP